jgi:hypothetical protein
LSQSACSKNQPISDEQLYASFSKRESQNEKGFKKAIEKSRTVHFENTFKPAIKNRK